MDYNYSCFINEETSPERLSSWPKITQVVRTWSQKASSLLPVSRGHTHNYSPLLQLQRGLPTERFEKIKNLEAAIAQIKTNKRKTKSSQKRNYKTKISKVWMSRTKNYNTDKDILTGDFQMRKLNPLKTGLGKGFELKDGGMVRIRKGDI